jgi:hypothetical protein
MPKKLAPAAQGACRRELCQVYEDTLESNASGLEDNAIRLGCNSRSFHPTICGCRRSKRLCSGGEGRRAVFGRLLKIG